MGSGLMSMEQIIILLLIGYIIYSIDKEKDFFPVPTILVLIGIVLALIPFFDNIKVTENMIYQILLPGLLFVSAYQFSIKIFRKNMASILTLATVGIIVNVLVLGVLTWAFSFIFISVSFIGAMLIASILTPTDPVSVVPIIEKATNNKRIAGIVDGESMLNDGTSIVIFTSVISIITSKQTPNVWQFIGEFLLISFGGTAIGIFCGYLVSKIVHYSHHQQYQIMLSIILCYGSFMLAERLHVSGVLAVVASGMVLSFEYQRTIKEEQFRNSLNGFWEVVELSIQAILFLLIGIQVADYLKIEYLPFSILIYILMIAIRFLIVFAVGEIFHPRSWRYISLISWAGLKGSMSVFLILTLHARGMNWQETDLVVSITFMVVLLSLVVQSLTMAPLSKKLLGKHDS
ncbi:sodium:proton antiporter [Oceanobacillus profundus]|uniref:cation:proton antiporter n=1 Tax=Oceanobacillus profundus TaxID=372463 RepID=UPI00203D48B1|nr:sodium:proton antiporter [Oceanobacillus profundus]MCM3397590.1 sodium:proton antiporter [Oceanobacillus profundus]